MCDRNQLVYCKVYGSFCKACILFPDSPEDSRVCFIPNREFLREHHLEYTVKSPTNFDLVPLDYIVKSGRVSSVKHFDYQSVAQAAKLTQDVLVYILKQVVAATVQAAHKEYNIKLNLNVGSLKFRSCRVMFQASQDKADTVVTSCNSIFRANKQMMTNLRS